jgi:hypothetical protein
MRLYPIVNTLAAQARVFHGFAMLRRNKETNRVSPSFHRQLFQWGNNNSTGPIFTKQSQRTKCIINEGVICEASFTHGSSLCCRSDPALFARLLFISQVRGLRALLSCIPVFYLLFTQGSGTTAASGTDCVPHWSWRRMRHRNEERGSLRASCAARVVQTNPRARTTQVMSIRGGATVLGFLPKRSQRVKQQLS